MGDGYIEVREAKLLATVGLVFMLTWPAALFVLLWYAGSHAGGIDRSTLTVLGFVLSIPAVAAICFYRLPRVVRLYPQERLAHAFRGVFDKACFSRWHDLGDAKPRVRRAYIIESAGTEELSGGAAAVGCLLALMGPIGLLLSLGMQKKREVRKPVYVLQCVNVKGPLLVIEKRTIPHRVVDLYQAIASPEESDLVSGG